MNILMVMSAGEVIRIGTAIRLISTILLITSILLVSAVYNASDLPDVYKYIGYLIGGLLLIPGILGLIAKYQK